MNNWLNVEIGAVLLGDAISVDPRWDHGAFAASPLAEGAARRSDWFRPRVQVVDGRSAEVWMLFRRTLQEVRIRLIPGRRSLEEESILSRDLRHWTWLADALGAPCFRHRRGAIYRFPWGWVHAGAGSVYVSFVGPQGALPLPGAEGVTRAYRCSSCAAVMMLPYGGATRALRIHGGAPCERCGAVHWARVDDAVEHLSDDDGATARPVGEPLPSTWAPLDG
ncbi:MAG: hypothetical protein IPK80_24230 [Nannocystis sp.]|nr:hypothetical protein [Nannocystis sp.]